VIVCFGHFFQIDRSSPKFLEYFLRRWNGCNDFDKKWLRLNFGRLFFSKTHLVTLFITRVPNSASISLQVVLFLFLLRNYFLTIFFSCRGSFYCLPRNFLHGRCMFQLQQQSYCSNR
jgi:hypothetical protein